MRNIYRPTTLRLASRHCPRAVDYYEQGRAQFRDHFAAGIAAHAVLEAIGEAAQVLKESDGPTEQQVRDVADRAAKMLMDTGRTFDGTAEPPLSPDAVIEGRDLAVRWALDHPLSPTAHYELGAGFDRAWKPTGYDAADCRFRLIFDVLDYFEDGDDERMAPGVVVRDYKTSWATDAGELDTLQMKAQAVCAYHLAAAPGNPLKLPAPAEWVRQEVVNLRTRQTFARTLYLVEGSEDLDLIIRWRSDLIMAMDALDGMRVCAGCPACSSTWSLDQRMPCNGLHVARPARPGTGCMGCPWVLWCAPARDFLRQVGLVTGPDPWLTPDEMGSALAAAQAQVAALDTLARAALEEHGPLALADGASVGYQTTEKREPRPDAGLLLLERWEASGGEPRGLLKVLSPGVTSIKAVAKALLPEREQVAEREALIESVTIAKTSKRFGVSKK